MGDVNNSCTHALPCFNLLSFFCSAKIVFENVTACLVRLSGYFVSSQLPDSFPSNSCHQHKMIRPRLNETEFIKSCQDRTCWDYDLFDCLAFHCNQIFCPNSTIHSILPTSTYLGPITSPVIPSQSDSLPFTPCYPSYHHSIHSILLSTLYYPAPHINSVLLFTWHYPLLIH
jgi:hypothetical protein